MWKSLILATAAGALAWGWSAAHQRRSSERSERSRATPQRKPRHVATWEGEGGALEATGAQLGPDPLPRACGRAAARDRDRG